MEIDDIGYSVVTAFSRVTKFIYSLFTTETEATTPDAIMTEAPPTDVTTTEAPSTEEDYILTPPAINMPSYVAKIKIDDLTINFQIPKTLSFEKGDLFVLDINQSTINEINVSDLGYKLSLTQYFRFIKDTDANGIVIDLIINTDHKYICIKYDSAGNIVSDKFDAHYNTYANYSDIKEDHFAGIVPDPNARRLRTENKYNYEAQRADYTEKNQTTKKPNIALSSAEAQSQHSPINNINNAYSMLPIDTRMYDLHRHAVEGLGTIAATRYADNVNDLTEVTTGKPIKDQTKPLLFDRKIKLAQATRDLVDVAHDFRVIKNMANFVNIISNGNDGTFARDLNTKLGGLLSSPGNKINVANSHQILKDNIRDLEQDLRETLNFPDIPTERYVSRDYAFAMFVIDMMNTTTETQIRSNYSESGKQVNIGTFKTYYESLDDAEKDSFDLYVVKIMGHREVGEAMKGRPDEYPSILKKIDLDGCSTRNTVTDGKDVQATITNVYGYLNVSLNGKNKKGFTIEISDNANPSNAILRLTTPAKFTITYDDVANYIMSNFPGITFPNRGNSDLTKITTTRQPENAYIEFHTASPDLKLLASLCLKTFCDKLYRTEHGGINSTEIVTHICTTDSYVYADPIIEYLAGNAASIPTIMRSGDERTTGEKTDEPPPDICELGSMGVSGRGFYMQPGVNSNSYIDSNYAKILKKTLGYACFLEYLFSISDRRIKSTSGSPKLTLPNKMENVFFEQSNSDTLFSTEAETKVGSLIKPMPSYRLINFIERLIFNKPLLDTTDINIYSYETIIHDIFKLEYNAIVKKVKAYIEDIKQIIDLNLADKDNIKTKVIRLPDLEELLTISSPSFCVENDDSLIVSKDRVLIEEPSPYWKIASVVTAPNSENAADEPVQRPTFADVIFSSTGIQIIGGNVEFQSMVSNQEEYKTSGGITRGPITLELLCKLETLAITEEVRSKINDRIANIITDFCKTRNLVCSIRKRKIKISRVTERIIKPMRLLKKPKITIKKRSREIPTSASFPKNRELKPIDLFQSNDEQPAGATSYNVSNDLLNADESTPNNADESTPNNASKRTRKGGSRHRKKASRKRNGRKMIHRTRKYKHH